MIVVPVLRQVEALNASRPADPQPCYDRFKALRLQELMFSHGIRRCAPVISKNRGAGGFEHEPLLRTKSPGREAKQLQRIPPPAPTSAPSTAPYLMPISDLMTLRAPQSPLTPTSAPRSKRQLEEDLCESLRRSFTWVRTTQCRVLMVERAYTRGTTMKSTEVTRARAIPVTRRRPSHDKTREATKSAQEAAMPVAAPPISLKLPVAICLPVVQPCCVLPIEAPSTIFLKAKAVYANQLTEGDTDWWLQRARVLRLLKKLHTRKRRRHVNNRQVNYTKPAHHICQHVVRPAKLLFKKKIKGWEKRAASRRRLITRRTLSAWEKTVLKEGALADKDTHLNHAHFFNPSPLVCTAVISNCIVSWKTCLTLSSSLIRGIIS